METFVEAEMRFVFTNALNEFIRSDAFNANNNFISGKMYENHSSGRAIPIKCEPEREIEVSQSENGIRCVNYSELVRIRLRI